MIILDFIKMFFMLVFGHCLADTALQPDPMAKGKFRNREIDMSRVPKGQKPLNLWAMWLTHHAMIQGGMTALITRNVWIGMIEAISHWIIDFFKCENKYNPNIDQLLHLGMKVIYCVILIILQGNGVTE